MISFASDYIAGAHPVIMQRLLETNMENLSGYGTDQYCTQAKEKIKQAFQCPDGEVFFLVGGTQTNQVIISTMLAPYEGVIAAKTGHVSVHEDAKNGRRCREQRDLPLRQTLYLRRHARPAGGRPPRQHGAGALRAGEQGPDGRGAGLRRRAGTRKAQVPLRRGPGLGLPDAGAAAAGAFPQGAHLLHLLRGRQGGHPLWGAV